MEQINNEKFAGISIPEYIRELVATEEKPQNLSKENTILNHALTCRDKVTVQCKQYGYKAVNQSYFTYIATPVGVWRFCPVMADNGSYVLSLMHHNFLHDINALDEMSDDDNIFRRELCRHNFHFQHDRKEFANVECLFTYINRHDKSKQHELEDISRMPRNTKNQRKWHRHAENRKRRREIRNVYAIIESLSSETNNKKVFAHA